MAGTLRLALFHNLPSGGGKRALYELARVLHSRGYGLELYTPDTADERFLPLAPFCSTVHRFAHGRPAAPHARRWRPRLPAVAAALAFTASVESLHREIARQMDAARPDLAFVHECRHTTSPFLLKYLKAPSVFYCAEPRRGLYEFGRWDRRDYESPGARGGPSGLLRTAAEELYRRRMRRIDQSNARAADLLLTCSCYSRELIWRAFGVFARTSYLGVDVQRFRPGTGERERMVLSVGELVPRKGHDFVIRAVGLIPPSRRPRVVLAANGGWEQERIFLASLAEARGVDLEIQTNLDDSRLVPLYGRAGALAAAAIMEPFGLVTLEAMACATPVVGVREGGFRESVLDGVTGFLTDRDEREFAERLEQVLVGDRGRSLGRAGRGRVEARWTWDQATDRLEANLAVATAARVARETPDGGGFRAAETSG